MTDCGWRSLARVSTCTLVPPGSNDTALLRRKTQSSVPSSCHTALSTIVGSSVSVWVGATDSLSPQVRGRLIHRCRCRFSSRYRCSGSYQLASSFFLATGIPAGVNGGCVASSSFPNYPAGAAQAVDLLIQEILVSSGKTLGNGMSWILEVRVIVGS